MKRHAVTTAHFTLTLAKALACQFIPVLRLVVAWLLLDTLWRWIELKFCIHGDVLRRDIATLMKLLLVTVFYEDNVCDDGAE